MSSASVASFSTAFGYNFSFMLLARCLSFGINIYLLRVVDQNVLGVANVRLTLLYTTILFLVREPFRRACLSQAEADTTCKDCDAPSSTDTEADVEHPVQRQKLVNLLWWCPLLALPLTAVLCGVWVLLLTHPDNTPNYVQAVVIFGVSACIESLSEPLWVYAQKLYLVRWVALTNAVHVLSERLLVLGLTALGWCDQLTAFTAATLLSSTLYTVMFYWRFWSLIRERNKSVPLESITQLLPLDWSAGYDRPRWLLAKSFIVHSAVGLEDLLCANVKQLLTDGAGYVMTFIDLMTFSEQGIYNTIEKLGSLVARILLAPLEESAYVYFSKNIDRNLRPEHQNPLTYRTAMMVLRGLLRSTAVIGLTVCIFGCTYSYLALLIYGGHALVANSGARLLRAYCVYVWLLAVNGVTECFAFATMKKEQVRTHQHFLFVFSGFYVLAQAAFASYFGGVGFIVANALNMMARIVYSLVHMHRFSSAGRDMLLADADLRGEGWLPADAESPLWQLCPNKNTALVLFLSLFFTALSSALFCCDGLFNTLAHVAFGAIAFGSTAVVILQTDFELIEFLDRFVFHSKAE